MKQPHCMLLTVVLAGLITGAAAEVVAQAGTPLAALHTGETVANSDGRTTPHARPEKFRYRDGPKMELTGDREFRGGVVVDTGRIVLIPRVGQFVAEYDPVTEQLLRTAQHGQPGGFGFGSVVDGTLVVMTPRGSRSVGLYDSGTQRYRNGAAHGQASDNAFLGSAMVRPDLIVFAPLNARVVGLYNPQTDTYRDGPVVPEQGHYLFSDIRVSSRTGEVIFTPFDSAHVGIYDPDQNVYIQGPAHGAGTTSAYSGIAELADGTLVMAPRNAEHIGLYHPKTRTFHQGPAHGEGPGAFMAAQRWPSGEVLMAPYRAPHVGIYDPHSREYRSGPSVAHVDVLPHGQRFSGAILTAAGDQIVMSNRGADRLGIIEAVAESAAGRHVTVTYDADELPSEARPPWSCHEIENCSVAVQDGVLHVCDNGTAQGELQFISYAWQANPELLHSVQARVKVAHCSGPAGVVLLAANGVREVGLTLFPDRIEIHRLDARAEVNLTDDFRDVRLEMAGDDAVVKVDGRVVLDLTGKSTWEAHAGRNVIGFGSLSSAATGEAWWDRVIWSVQQPEVSVYPLAEHHVVFKQEGVYACFPSLYQYEDGTLVTSFGTRVRRSHIDNTGGSLRMVSRDGGITWTEAGPDFPSYNPDAVRADGHLAIANAIGWRYVDQREAQRLIEEQRTVRDVRPGTVAYLSGAHSTVRSIRGETIRPWTEIEVPPGGGMMSFHQAAYLNVGGGVRLVGIYDTGPEGRRSAFVLRTEDDGDTWTCLPMAMGDAETSYNETALAVNTDGHVIALMRTAESADKNRAGYLYQVTSTDGGQTWSEPVDTGIWGYPAHLLRLPDGRLLATYGYRRAPMGVRACLSLDGGTTWDLDNEIILRADGFGSGSDLGYPITSRLADGTLATIYYVNGIDNITHICLTRWTPPGPGASFTPR